MKKTISLILAVLMLCLALPTLGLAATAVDATTLAGTWELTEATLNGEPAPELKGILVITLNADGTAEGINKMQNLQQSGTWKVSGDQVLITLDGLEQAFTLDGPNKMWAVEDGSSKFVLEKTSAAEPAPAGAAGGLAGFLAGKVQQQQAASGPVGLWRLTSAEWAGQQLDLGALGIEETILINADGTAVIEASSLDGPTSATWTLSGDQFTIVSNIPEYGTLDGDTLTLKENIMDSEMTMVFTREQGAAPEPAPAPAPAPEPDSGESLFFGTWKFSAMEVQGFRMNMDLLKVMLGANMYKDELNTIMMMTITVSNGQAVLSTEGEDDIVVSTSYADSVLKLNGDQMAEADAKLRITEEGELAMDAMMEGMPATMYFTR